MSGLFSTFNVAKRGIFVQQKAIDVTSHNIANANTEGYSRQRAKIETSKPFGMPTINNAAEVGQLGTGSQISAIERVRDSFLDYQVRAETSTYGKYETREKFLNEIESIFNEPSDTGLSTLMGKFFDSWQQLSKQADSSNSRTVVAQQSAALADELNHTYTQLQNLKDNANSLIKNSVFEVNNILNQLDQINQQVIGVKVAGNMPNDLMDRRDLLLDQLSLKFNISIDKKNFDAYDVKPVDASGLTNVDANSEASILKSEPNNISKKFSYVDSIESTGTAGSYKITYYKLGDKSSDSNKEEMIVTGLDADKVKEIESTRILWASSDGLAIKANGSKIIDADKTDTNYPTVAYSELALFKPSSGELNGYMSMMTDIDSYTDQLNKLAKALAFSVNAVHSGKADSTADNIPFFVNSSVGGTEDKITAGNISVNKAILVDPMKIKTRTNDYKYANASDNTEDGESDGVRAKAIAGLRDVLIKIQGIGETTSRNNIFGTGGPNELTNNGLTITNNVNGMTVANYFKDTIDKLGVQGQEAKRIVKNQEALLDSFNESKLSVSGVSLDEEMANLIQFQHAYQANAKIIATVDELLEVVINGLKR